MAELNLIVWAAWDPIGFGVPMNEYESYVPRIAALLERGATEHAIEGELRRIRTGPIGDEGDWERDGLAARKICTWYAEARVG